MYLMQKNNLKELLKTKDKSYLFKHFARLF